MRRKKQKKIEKVIISLYKASRGASLEMLSTILGTSLKMDKRNQCKEQEQQQQQQKALQITKKYDTIIFPVVTNTPDSVIQDYYVLLHSKGAKSMLQKAGMCIKKVSFD